MSTANRNRSLHQLLQGLSAKEFSPLDLFSRGSMTERILALVLGEVPPPGGAELTRAWQDLCTGLQNVEVSDLRVVVLGGGTGLSNIIGGDSRRQEWRKAPFTGLKEVFPNLHSIVCVTDDGGSTGEILKDFPFVALGDLRHVLLASARQTTLKSKYQLDDRGAALVAGGLHSLFNYRFTRPPATAGQLLEDCRLRLDMFPDEMAEYFGDLLHRLYNDERMAPGLQRPQCLGNLLLAAAMYRNLPEPEGDPLVVSDERVQQATMQGLADFAAVIGAGRNSVLPCTTTPAQLQILYANGVLVTSEAKSGTARRGYPVDRVLVEFADEPHLPPGVMELVRDADIIIMAPGSLYSSIIPILQVPGLADLIRRNSDALKLLVANIWVQKGETDATREAPERKFHVSDLILAYDHNISGGIRDLFSHVLTLDLADIPGSVLQSYAIEEKEPIYLDRSRVRELGFEAVEACIFSRNLLEQSRVIQHDPTSLSRVVQALWGLRDAGFFSGPDVDGELPFSMKYSPVVCRDQMIPCTRYRMIRKKLDAVDYKELTLQTGRSEEMTGESRSVFRDRLVDIVWGHPDIHPDHLLSVAGVCLIETGCWKRCQEWDNVFSFYDPEDGCIKIRKDQVESSSRLEMAFLVGLGQSLLGNYAETKGLQEVRFLEEEVGRIYCLTIRRQKERICLFTTEELDTYLQLTRMCPARNQDRLYTRVVNDQEGFTPPGLLFGLTFAWYLDNRFAPNIDYKMSIMKHELSYLIPEQVRLVGRREQLIRFFRENVFRRQLPKVRLSG